MTYVWNRPLTGSAPRRVVVVPAIARSSRIWPTAAPIGNSFGPPIMMPSSSHRPPATAAMPACGSSACAKRWKPLLPICVTASACTSPDRTPPGACSRRSAPRSRPITAASYSTALWSSRYGHGNPDRVTQPARVNMHQASKGSTIASPRSPGSPGPLAPRRPVPADTCARCGA